jgi:protein AFG1
MECKHCSGSTALRVADLSTRHPDELYKGGLQRDLFLPFLKRLKEESEVHDMASPVDYRKLAHHSKGMYFTPHDSEDADSELTRHFADLAAIAGGGAPTHRQVAVQMGRKLEVPLAGYPPPPPLPTRQKDLQALLQ